MCISRIHLMIQQFIFRLLLPHSSNEFFSVRLTIIPQFQNENYKKKILDVWEELRVYGRMTQRPRLKLCLEKRNVQYWQDIMQRRTSYVVGSDDFVFVTFENFKFDWWALNFDKCRFALLYFINLHICISLPWNEEIAIGFKY